LQLKLVLQRVDHVSRVTNVSAGEANVSVSGGVFTFMQSFLLLTESSLVLLAWGIVQLVKAVLCVTSVCVHVRINLIRLAHIIAAIGRDL